MTDLLISRDEPLDANITLSAYVSLYATVQVADYLDDPTETITLDELLHRMAGNYDRFSQRWYVHPDTLHTHLAERGGLHVDEITWGPGKPSPELRGNVVFERPWQAERRRDGLQEVIGHAKYVTLRDATYEAA